MTPPLSRQIISYLAPSTKEEYQYTHPDYSSQEIDNIYNDRDNQEDGDDPADEEYESSPGDLEDDGHLTNMRSLVPRSTIDGASKTLKKRAKWSYTGYKGGPVWPKSMQTRYGSNFIDRPQPWPKKKTTFSFGDTDKNGKLKKETATIAKCINDFPVTLSTCEINGQPGSEYATHLTDSINGVANSTNRRDRDLGLERVTDYLEEIAESRCDIPKLCRKTVNRQIAYLRRPEDQADPAYVPFRLIFRFLIVELTQTFQT